MTRQPDIARVPPSAGPATPRRAGPRPCLSLLLVAALVCSGPAAAGKKKPESKDEVDYLALASLLINDGHYDRAEEALENVDENDENLDRPRLLILRGLVFLHKGLYVEARDSLAGAVKLGRNEPLVHLYLAQASYGMNDCKQALADLDMAGPSAEAVPETFLMRSQCHWKLGHKHQSWKALDGGEARHPGFPGFARQRFFCLVDLGLYQEAARLGQALLSSEEATVEDSIALGEALRKSGQTEKAKMFLEAALLRYPDEEDVIVGLAHAYLDSGMALTAAELFDRASRSNPDLVVEAAELYRRARCFARALLLNAMVGPQKEKLKQRLSILLDSGNYEAAAALEDRLSRLGLLADEDVRYALAFSLFQVGDFDGAEAHLKKLTRTDLFQKAAQLRKAMAACSDKGWLCQ